MNCPTCKVDLVMADRHGVEIDYCPTCRGVWLDRGELDKIVERAAGERYDGGRRHVEPRRDPRDSGEYRYDRDPGRRRKKGFLGELFDF